MEINSIINADAVEGLKQLPEHYADCCVTSPPFYMLRDYGVDGQIGLEETPEEYISKLMDVFDQVHRVLKPEGTLWLNLGDSYGGSGKGWSGKGKTFIQDYRRIGKKVKGYTSESIKPKDLIGIPWMVAFALRERGWYLRQDIIWHKPNPMPESVRDRCVSAHEYIFLLSKQSKYYYDSESIKEPATRQYGQANEFSREQKKEDLVPGQKQKQNRPDRQKRNPREVVDVRGGNQAKKDGIPSGTTRIKRSVWSVSPTSNRDAHYASYPEKLIKDCIKAGCPESGVVLDPFMGSGTTAVAALKLNRNYIGTELNPEYIAISTNRILDTLGLFNQQS